MANRKSHYQPLPISQRLTDIFIILNFMMFGFVAINRGPLSIWDALNPSNHSFSAEMVRKLVPKFMQDGLTDWGETVEPQFKINPSWARIMNVWNLFIHVPFYLIAIYAFITGRDWIRYPTAVCMTTVMYSTFVIMGNNIISPPYPIDLGTYYGSYIPFLVIPLLIIIRVAISGFDQDPIFKSKAKSSTSKKCQ